MTPLERLFRLEIEFHRQLREGREPQATASVHTSYALQMGYEGLIRSLGGVSPKEVTITAQKLLASGDARDVLKAGDSVKALLNLSTLES